MNPIKEIISRVDTELDKYGWYRSNTVGTVLIGTITDTALCSLR